MSNNKLKFDTVQFSQMFTNELLNDTTIDINNLLQEEFNREITEFLLRGSVLTEELPSVFCYYPKDWIQAFKERWLPKWILKKFPVKYIENITEIRAIYKDYKVNVEDVKAVINLKNIRGNDGYYKNVRRSNEKRY